MISAVTPSSPRFTSPETDTLPILSAVQLRPSTKGVALFNEASASCPETLMCATLPTCTPRPVTVSARLVSSPLVSSDPVPVPSTSATTLRTTSANSAVPARRTSPNVRITLVSVTSSRSSSVSSTRNSGS
ncbi:hypothetical protein D3C83_08750 [compost metagenome]